MEPDSPEGLALSGGDRTETDAPRANRPGGRVRRVLAFLAFFLGVSLTVGSLGAVAGRLAWQRDTEGLWSRDWQETPAFRGRVSGYLESFLTLGAGGPLEWYDMGLAQEYGYADVYTGATPPWGLSFENTIVSDSRSLAPGRGDTAEPTAPDAAYQNDKNVLYRIWVDGKIKYENTDMPTDAPDDDAALPEGYNFLLTFADGKVSIVKDGQPVDVYGSGVYDEDSLWFVPGYDNFPAGDSVDGVEIQMALRAIPMQYYRGDYAGGGVSQNNTMYWLYQNMQEGRAFYRTALLALGAGLALLVIARLLRRHRAWAEERIAAATVHVWTELRFLAVAGCLFLLLAGGIGGTDWWWEFYYEGFHLYFLTATARDVLACLDNVPALLGLVWTAWLIHNDHRHHPKEERRSLWRLVGVRMGKYPFQKRLTWRNRAAALLACLPALFLAVGLAVTRGWRHPVLLLPLIVSLLCAVAVLLALRRHAALARDVGLLADQVDAIREGNLSAPLTLPGDADLRQTAEHLNDIQAGMRRALEEQTRSERMKVELISNVSHDLKTPLTSILSYAELLRQEPLEGAAADYARIIDEKAQRLKAMVQDVFEVSKAAADQLPVQLERLDLAKLLRQTLADMDGPIQKSGLTFKVSLPETPVEIVADGKRLYRVFQNLIQNALRYSMDGSRVYLSLTAGPDRAEASLRNTSRTELPAGVDFTARFVRGDDSRTDGGSGLGLSIAQSFTEACGGEFRVETVADLFTAVVTFPLAD